jgi:hypothetical protein
MTLRQAVQNSGKGEEIFQTWQKYRADAEASVLRGEMEQLEPEADDAEPRELHEIVLPPSSEIRGDHRKKNQGEHFRLTGELAQPDQSSDRPELHLLRARSFLQQPQVQGRTYHSEGSGASDLPRPRSFCSLR